MEACPEKQESLNSPIIIKQQKASQDPVKVENQMQIEENKMPNSFQDTTLPKYPSLQQGDIEKIYKESLQQDIVGYVTDLPNSLFIAGTNASEPKLKRLSKEILKFSQFLPCQHTNAVFVRCDQTRMDSMNVLISGAMGTPYANGLYHFELFCDDSFPNAPPQMQLLTGKDIIGFNPNLYAEGYICLSLLGTWQGQPEQSWNPSTSSLSQVFVSIQSIVMSNDIYFNQPGYQSTKGSIEGNLYNQGYSNVVKIANIRHAMIQIIKKPPIGFQSVVKKHFQIKKEEILKECSQWLSQKDKPFYKCGYNSDLQNQIEHSYGQVLQKEIEELKLALSSLESE